DPRVRIPLDLVEQERGAAVEVFLDRGDLEVRIDFHVGGDELTDGVEVLEGRAQTRDVLLQRASSVIQTRPSSARGKAPSIGSDTAPRGRRRQGAPSSPLIMLATIPIALWASQLSGRGRPGFTTARGRRRYAGRPPPVVPGAGSARCPGG